MKQIFFLIAGALFFSGCGIYTNYKLEPLSGKNLLRSDLSVDTSAIAVPKWEQVFSDPLLLSLIREGLEKNANLLIAQSQVEEAKATLRSAQLALLPGANLTGSANVNSATDLSQIDYQLGADVSWTLDIFGRMNNQRKAAEVSLNERTAYVRAVRSQLVATIAEFYYMLEMLDAKLRITEKTIESWKQSVATQEALFQAGQSQRANVNQAKASQLQAEITWYELNIQIQKSENALCALLGRTPISLNRGMWGEFQIPEHIQIGIPLSMLAQRPDVARAEANLKLLVVPFIRV